MILPYYLTSIFFKVSALPNNSGQHLQPCGRSLETGFQVGQFTLGLSICQPDGHLTMLSPVPTVTKHFDCIPLLGKNILASTFIIGLFLYKLYYYQSAD